MIIFDTETTGLLKPSIVDLSLQPKIIEFAAIKLDDNTLEEVDRIEFLVNPEEKLEAVITKITGLKDEDLQDQMTLSHFFPTLCDFFLGEKYLIAHNVAFDVGVLKCELERLDRLTQFPYPPKQICTVQQSIHIKGYRLNLSKLHVELFSKHFEEAHRAMNDVEALTRCVKKMIEDEVIKL